MVGSFARPADLLVLDPSTGGVVEHVGAIGYSVTGLAKDPTTGILYGVTGGNDITNPGFLIKIDERTGAGTLIGDEIPATNRGANDITFRSDGTLFGWSSQTDDLVTIDKATGAATVVGNSGLSSTYGNGTAFAPSGALFVTPLGADDVLYTADPATGTVTPGPTMNGLTSNAINALAFDDAGSLFGVIGNFSGASGFGKLMTINTSTGELSFRARGVQALDAIEFVDEQARSISLAAKKKVKHGKKVKLKGTISSAATADCAANQPVQIERLSNGTFETAAVVTTDAAGAYSNAQRVTERTKFRAETTGAPAFCSDAVSPVKTVKVKKEK